ncbi:MAG TPA: baseplate J/gp47 family protein [Deinococcales bacterium]|nr:baseplate J/gp47 family protein [Deinococcales bacterium]
MAYPLDPFPTLEALQEDLRAILPVLEPRYTNLRPGDLALTAADGVLVALANDAFTPANTVTRRNMIEALRVLGEIPRLGAPASLTVTFTLGGILGTPVTVPTGSLWTSPDGLFTFALQGDVTIPAGNLTGTGTATAEQVGTGGNLAAGSALANTSAVPFIATATVATLGQGGEDDETDDDFLSRAIGEFRASNMAVKPADFEAAALAVPGVYRATCLARTSFTAPSTFTTPAAGHVTVLVIPDDGGLLSAPLQAAVYAALADRTFVDVVANGGLHVTDYQRLTVNVTYTVVASAGTTTGACQQAIADALTEVLDARAWPAGREVSAFELAAVLEGLPQVDRVRALTVNGSTLLTLTAQQVTTAGTITGTVS